MVFDVDFIKNDKKKNYCTKKFAWYLPLGMAS